MNIVFDLYRQLVITENTEDDTNFIDSLEYLENGIKLIEIIRSLNLDDISIIKGFKSKNLFEDYNKFNICEFNTISKLDNIQSEDFNLINLSENTYKIELQ